jgi:hypothetical protein
VPLPKIVVTPASQLRRKTRTDLERALAAAGHEATVDAAARRLVKRLGKPTWTEDNDKRVWVAVQGNACHRLVLRADGGMDIDGAAKNDWIMLSPVVRQNPCTGEIAK